SIKAIINRCGTQTCSMTILFRAFEIPANLIIVAVVSGFYLLLHLFRWLRWKFSAIKALNWPATEAVVESSYELDVSSRRTERWITALQYSYKVNSQYYSGTYFLPESLGSAAVAASAAHAWLHKN